MAKVSGSSPGTADAASSAIEWLKLMLAMVSVSGLIAVYFLLPTNSDSTLVAFVQACIPNAVTALLVFPIVFVVLGRVGLRSEDRLVDAIREGLVATDSGLTFANDIGEASDLIKSRVHSEARLGAVTVEVLGYTGATFTTAVLRDLIAEHPARLRLILRIIDLDRIDKAHLPGHFEQEANDTVSRLEALCREGADLEIWRYPSFPFVLGLCINSSDLFIAFPSWDVKTGALADKSLEYRYYERSAASEHLFQVFTNWANQPRQLQVVPSPTDRTADAHGAI
jgi:hypothetical protein